MSLFDTGVRPLIDNYLLEESKKLRDYGDYWSASSAGYCMRKVIFERLGVPKIEQPGDARKQRVFTAGHIFHDWIQKLTRDAGVSVAQEVELQDEDLMIRGHFDDLILIQDEYTTDGKPGQIIQFDGKPGGKGEKEAVRQFKARSSHLILYDYKTVNSGAFTWAKKNGSALSHYHKMQLGTYMYMLRNTQQKMLNDLTNLKIDGYKYNIKTTDAPNLPTLTEARILKISKDDLRMDEQQLLWSPELEKEVVNYWRTLNGYWKNKKLPKCTCADYENGFLAKEQYNGYFYEGEPCSLKYYLKWKEEQDGKTVSTSAA